MATGQITCDRKSMTGNAAVLVAGCCIIQNAIHVMGVVRAQGKGQTYTHRMPSAYVRMHTHPHRTTLAEETGHALAIRGRQN